MQLPRLAVRDLYHGDAEPAENFEVDAGIAANLRDAAQQEDRHVAAALHQRARDDEPVAAVVAAAAQHGDLAIHEIAVHRLHGRHRLPAGILHEDERRNADLFDRPAIG